MLACTDGAPLPLPLLQFGHLFAKADTREAAIRAMVVALREVAIRGEIHTICDYVQGMLQVGRGHGLGCGLAAALLLGCCH